MDAFDEEINNNNNASFLPSHSLRYAEELMDENPLHAHIDDHIDSLSLAIDWEHQFSSDNAMAESKMGNNDNKGDSRVQKGEEFDLELGLLESLGIENCSIERIVEESDRGDVAKINVSVAGLTDPYYSDVYPLVGGDELDCMYIGMYRVPLGKEDRVSEILIRPDIVEDSVLTLVETILMTFNGTVMRRPSANNVGTIIVGSTVIACSIVELSSLSISAGSSNKYSLRAYLTVNASLQRVLVVHLAPEPVPANAGTILANVLRADSSPIIRSFFQSVQQQLAGALYGEGFALAYLLNISCHATCAINQSNYNKSQAMARLDSLNTPVVEALLNPMPSVDQELKKPKRVKKVAKLNPFDESDSESDEEAETAPKRTDGGNPQESWKSRSFESGFRFLSELLVQDVGIQLDSVVDPAYVRDLQVAAANLMTRKLIAEIDPMEKEVKQTELSCARLMTVLKPSYQRCGLNMPSPPNQRALTDYALPLKRQPITEVSLDTARLLILRARRSAREKLGQMGGARENWETTAAAVISSDATVIANSKALLIDEDDDGDDFETPVLNPESTAAVAADNSISWADNISDRIALLTTVVNCVVEQVMEWQIDEGAARLARKTEAVADRLRSIDEFKLKLVSTLHYRNVAKTTQADRIAIDSLKEKCRVINDDDPLLLEMTASHGGRSGTLYVTLDHIFFYSYGGIFQALFVKLFPIARLVSISSEDATSTFSAGSVVLEDEGGVKTLFEVAGPTGDYHTRVADVLNQLQQIRLLESLGVRNVPISKAVVESSKPSQPQPLPASPPPKSTPSSLPIATEALVQKPVSSLDTSSSSSSSTATNDTLALFGFLQGSSAVLPRKDPEKVTVPVVSADATLIDLESVLQDLASIDNLKVSATTAVAAPTVTSTSNGGIGANVPPPVLNTTFGLPPKSPDADVVLKSDAPKKAGLGRNIQAFLAQSQAASKK